MFLLLEFLKVKILENFEELVGGLLFTFLDFFYIWFLVEIFWFLVVLRFYVEGLFLFFVGNLLVF